MDDAKLEIASSENFNAHSVPFAAAPAPKESNSRHLAVTADLRSYLRYKMWTAKIRNAFEEAK